MATLDKSREYGDVYGSPENGARYHQDGKYFGGDGQEIIENQDAPASLEELVEAKTSKSKAKAKVVVEEVKIEEPPVEEVKGDDIV